MHPGNSKYKRLLLDHCHLIFRSFVWAFVCALFVWKTPCITCVQYRGGVQYREGISWRIWGGGGGVILSTVGDTQYRGGYHDARGDIMSTVGKVFCYLSTPRVINTPTVLMISPTVLKLQRMVSPHNTHNIPHVHHDIPHGTEYPPWHSRYPTFIMIPPTVLYTRYTGWKSLLGRQAFSGKRLFSKSLGCTFRLKEVLKNFLLVRT